MADFVVDVLVGFLITDEGWGDDGDEDDEEGGEEFDDCIANFVETRHECAMVELGDEFVTGENEGGEDGDGTDDPEQDAFSHNEAKIETESESHKTESEKAGNGSGGTADYRT